MKIAEVYFSFNALLVFFVLESPLVDGQQEDIHNATRVRLAAGLQYESQFYTRSGKGNPTTRI